VIQSHNISKKKSKTLKDEIFIISSYFMMMEKFEYCSFLKQLNEEQRLISNDVMHRKKLYHDILICLFLTRGVGT